MLTISLSIGNKLMLVQLQHHSNVTHALWIVTVTWFIVFENQIKNKINRGNDLILALVLNHFRSYCLTG